MTSVLGLGQLPCLETLELEGNPLTRESMARIRVLSAFEERAEQVGYRLPRALVVYPLKLAVHSSCHVTIPLPDSFFFDGSWEMK